MRQTLLRELHKRSKQSTHYQPGYSLMEINQNQTHSLQTDPCHFAVTGN